MEVIIRPNIDHAVDLVVKLIVSRIKEKPDTTLGLATGRTMERVYARLIASGVSFAQCQTFNLDEYIGLRHADPNSYRSYMKAHLFDHVEINLANTHVPDGSAADLKKAARDYESLIADAGGIDLQLLGIGYAGHIGFNEPLSSFKSRTRDKALTPTTRAQNAEMFGGDADNVPKRALTMGVGTILDASELVLLATGAAKAAIVAKAVEGPITSMVSASAIQMHPNCKVVTDEAAATELQGREYYDFVFENEPEWKGFRCAEN
ncbi:glucosamine-6-phosphate deaminase [Loktanella sp. Alg231-35]|uniref:glucosamine-6-phosphate deaminase n=1 Tax=Loktanella sp. Alg231-35 TaxID=1922220 RepID=UPI000D552A00|nr:glucosamine-6-phosphate deaminase [Loktanella sp. Alg231-35]